MREAIEKHFDPQVNRMLMDASKVTASWEAAGIPKAKIKIALEQIWARYDDAPYETPGKGQAVHADQGHVGRANPRAPNGGGEGHVWFADKAKSQAPSSSPTQSRDVGQKISADEASFPLPTVAATERSGGGQTVLADKAKIAVPPSAAPQGNGVGHSEAADKASAVAPRPVPAPPSAARHTPKDPTPSQVAALVRMHQKVHVGPLDDLELGDGRTLGSVLGTELPTVIDNMQSELAVIGRSLYGKGHQLLVAKHIYETYVKGSDNAKRPLSEIVPDADASRAIAAVKSSIDEKLADVRKVLDGVPASLAIEHIAKEARV